LSLEPDNLSVLAPDLVTAPSPEITPENVCVVPAVALENVNVLPTDVMAMLPLYDALVPSVPDTVMLPPDAAIVVLPEYVLAADIVNVPEPDFVNVPVDVAIGSATTTSPVFASNVKLNVPVIALPDDGSNVNVPESD